VTAPQLVVRNARLVVPEIGIVEGHLVAENGRVRDLLPATSAPPAAETEIDAHGAYVLPGAIDAHSHYGLLPPVSERISPESAFAATGGVTTMVRYFRRTDSYLSTVPPHIQSNPSVHYQDFSLHLALFNEGQVNEIPACLEQLGVTSYKVYMNLKAPVARNFLIDPLVTDTAIQTADLDYDDGLLMAAMEAMQALPARVRLSVHVEEADLIIRQSAKVRASGLGGLVAWHYARPAEAEALGISKVAYLSRQFGVPVFFPHIGSRLGIAALAQEQARGTEMVAETCPHYLVQNIQSEARELLKVMPPVRTVEDNRATWQALQSGVITVMGTDHIPWTTEEKGKGDIWSVRPAFGSTGLMVPILLSEGLNRGRLTILDVANLTSGATARAFGLYPLKGTLLPGSDADLMIVDTDAEWVVQPDALPTAQRFSVYAGFHLKGQVTHTVVRGQPIYHDGKMLVAPGHGRYIRRFPQLELDGR
jgi:dihydropyrimidinase